MNKTEMVKAIASKTGETNVLAEKMLTATIDVIKETLVAGDKISIVNFGTFEAVERAERQGVNPSTGAKITIPASKSPKFKAGKSFKEAVNQ